MLCYYLVISREDTEELQCPRIMTIEGRKIRCRNHDTDHELHIFECERSNGIISKYKMR